MAGGKMILAAKAAPLNPRQKKQVKRLIASQQEQKYFDQNASATGVASSGSIIGALCIPAQGDGESARDGDTILMKKISINFQITATDLYNIVRVVIFQWQENNAANPPTIAKVFEQVATNPWLAQLRHDYINAGSLVVMHDKMYVSMTTSDTATLTRRLEFTGKKLHKKKIEFDAAAVTGWDNYYIAVISDSAAVTHPSFSYCCRCSYVD